MTAFMTEALVWQAAAEYRLEPMEWLEGLRDRYEPEAAEWSRRRRSRVQEIYEQLGGVGAMPRGREPATAEQIRLERLAYDQTREEMPMPVAVRIANQAHNELVRYQRDKERKSPLPSWRNTVLVSKGKQPEYSLLQVNLAEQLLFMAKQFKGRETYVQDTALLFCRSYGDLDVGPPSDELEDWNTLEKWAKFLSNVDELTSFLRGETERTFFQAAEMHVVLRNEGIGGRPKMVFLPTSMSEFVGYQFAELASGGSKLDNCLECGRPFFHGGSSSRKAGALYCDEVCREKSKTKRRAVARKAEREGPKTRTRKR